MSIITKTKGSLEYLTAEGISVPHCFTTRLGGVSKGSLSSLNIGTSRGDAPENVLKNYRILADALGFAEENLVLSHQTHSDIVRLAEEKDRGAGLFRPALSDCDALVTNTPGLALVVFTADCTPILFYDPVTGAVGAAHAGWRGTALSIGARTVEAMHKHFGSRPQDIRAAIGPNIGMCHFETNQDVPRAMEAAFGQSADPYIRRKGDKSFLDLKQINAMVLRNAGVSHIEISDACTVCESQRFWSHRVTAGDRGSQGAVIVCGEAEK